MYATMADQKRNNTDGTSITELGEGFRERAEQMNRNSGEPFPGEGYSKRTNGGLIKREEGQSVIEFAILMPMLILLLMLTVDFGMVQLTEVMLKDAARNGATFGSTSYAAALNSAGIVSAVRGVTSRIPGSTPNVVSSIQTDPYGYQLLVVTVSSVYTPIFRYPGMPDANLSASVEMRISD